MNKVNDVGLQLSDTLSLMTEKMRAHYSYTMALFKQHTSKQQLHRYDIFLTTLGFSRYVFTLFTGIMNSSFSHPKKNEEVIIAIIDNHVKLQGHTVCDGCQLEDGVQWNINIRYILRKLVQEVAHDTTHHSLKSLLTHILYINSTCKLL